MAVVEITGLYRYPVKSMQGEPLQRVPVGPHGIDGDRSHAVRDDGSGIVLTGRRDPQMLEAQGVVGDDGSVQVRLPDGSIAAGAELLSKWIGRPVSLVGPTASPSTYEIAVDAEDDDSEVVTWQGPAGSFHDSARTQLSILAAGDLRQWDVRRFRPNVVIDAATADDLVGRRVRAGGVVLDVVKHIERCVMVTRPQPGGIERDLDVLRTIRRERDLMLGVGALVVTQGTIAVGDRLELVHGR